MNITLTPGTLTLQTLRRVSKEPVQLTLNEASIKDIKRSCAFINEIVTKNEVVYGVTTGFGMLANKKIEAHDIQELQKKIILSHSAGVGEYLDDAIVRLILLLKINSLARGFSGVRYELIQTLIALLNAEIYPCIPQKGSVGASGDLAPLAHMSSVIIGEGEARYKNKIISAKRALEIAQIKPIELQAKEGLALLNGTQVSTALALQGLFLSENLYASGIVIGSMSVEAALASRAPFDEKIHVLRGLQEQIDTASMFRSLLQTRSEISDLHINCEKVQDPYSLRCQPQVMGACLFQIRTVAKLLENEANSVTDNPLVFTDERQVISGGNFHAEPVAMSADNLALAISEIGSISERRTALLVDKNLSQLPPFLMKNSGVNSGFMIPQVTAAALVSENKALSHPSSTDSIPTSANQEDHVSMATYAAKRLLTMSENTASILGIELLASTQGIDMRSPATSTQVIENAKRILRDKVSFYSEDRHFYTDIQYATDIVLSGVYNSFLPKEFIPSF